MKLKRWWIYSRKHFSNKCIQCCIPKTCHLNTKTVTCWITSHCLFHFLLIKMWQSSELKRHFSIFICSKKGQYVTVSNSVTNEKEKFWFLLRTIQHCRILTNNGNKEFSSVIVFYIHMIQHTHAYTYTHVSIHVCIMRSFIFPVSTSGWCLNCIELELFMLIFKASRQWSNS